MNKNFNVKIGKTVWAVKFLPFRSALLDGNDGLICYREDTIYILDGMSAQRTNAVVAHELTHALFAESGFNIDIKNALGNFYEHFVDAVSKNLSDVCEIVRVHK